MNLLDGLMQVNYVAVLAATLASFVLGFIWYHPKVFGTRRMKEEGLTEEEAAKGNMALTMGGSFVVTFIKATVLSLLVGGNGLIIGIRMGLLLGIGFVATSVASHFLFSQRSLTHYRIVVGYDIILFVLMGAIVGGRPR